MPAIPSEAEVLTYFERYSNWGRWGKQDQAGTLNHITPAKRIEAARLVRDGITVTCARPLTTEIAPDTRHQFQHYMVASGEAFDGCPTPPGGAQSASDFIGMVFHGLTFTHVDSLGHFFRDGLAYNGVPAAQVNTRQGATVHSVDAAKDGVVTRGILADIPRIRNVAWLEPGEPVYREDLEAAERAAGLRLGPGDALMVRTGSFKRRLEVGPFDELTRPGLHVNCIPFLHERGVSVLGTDAGGDVIPSGYPNLLHPIHQIGIVALGLWLIDSCNFEELAAACAQRSRWEFQFAMGPLRIQYGTGSPVNPIAIL